MLCMKAAQFQGPMLSTPSHMEQATQQCLASHLVYNIADLLLKGGASAADGLAHGVDKAQKSFRMVYALAPEEEEKFEAHLTETSVTRVHLSLSYHLISLKGCRSKQSFNSKSLNVCALINAEHHPAEANTNTKQLQHLCKP